MGKRSTAVYLTVTVAALSCCGRPGDDVLVVGEQSPLEGELVITGRVETLSVSPDDRIWMPSRVGQIAVTDSVMGAWRFALDLFGGDWDRLLSPATLDRVTFFTSDTAIATGRFLPGPYSDTTSAALLRTVDGGVTWDTVSHGTRAWIRDVQAGADGRAWMGGSDGKLLTTSDYGATWRQRTPPFPDSRPLAAILMVDDRHGFVGAAGNAIRRTRNAGESWSDVPTPMDQGLVASHESTASTIQDLIHFEGWLLATQLERVFATRTERIQWEEVEAKPAVIRVAVDRHRSSLFGIAEDLSLVTFDERLRPEDFGSTRLHAEPVDLVVHDGAAYVLDSEGGVYRVTEDGTEYSFPLSSEPRETMPRVRVVAGVLWGATDHHLYRSTDAGERWNRVAFTPFTIRSFEIIDRDRLLLWDGHGSNSVFDRTDGTLRPVASLRGYDLAGVKRLDDVWFAYGGRQYETTYRVDVGRTYFGGQFRGSRDNGFVMESDDSGVTWASVDEWLEGGVATPDNSGDVPYVEEPRVVFLDASGRGFIDGWTHHLGLKRFETFDGGSTWRQVLRPRRHFDRAVWTPGGYIGAVNAWGLADSASAELYRLSAGSERLVYRSDSHAVEEYRMPVSGVSWAEGVDVLLALDESEFVIVDTSTGNARPALDTKVR